MSRSGLPVLVMTGGFGQVARMLLPRLRRSFFVHSVDRIDGQVPVSPDRRTIGDLSDPDVLAHAFRGADALLHLAADPDPAAPWSHALANADITRRALLAAREASIERTVVASSVHAAGGSFRSGEIPVNPYGAGAPCCEYGVGKLAGENLARLHYDTVGTSVRVLRLGLTAHDPIGRDDAKTWLGDGDAAALVIRCLQAGRGFGIYHGVSRTAQRFWNVDNAASDLGWTPRDEVPKRAERLAPRDDAGCPLFEPLMR